MCSIYISYTVLLWHFCHKPTIRKMNPFFAPNIPMFPAWPRLCFNCLFGHFKNRDKRNLPFTPILASVNRLVRYHLGTVAKGSFIITLVKIPRMILMYIHSQLKGKVRGKIRSWTFRGHIPDLTSAPNDVMSKSAIVFFRFLTKWNPALPPLPPPPLHSICSSKIHLSTGFQKCPFLCVNSTPSSLEPLPSPRQWK